MAVGVDMPLAKATTKTLRVRHWNLLPYYLALPILLYEGIFIILPIVQEIGSSFTSDVIGMGNVKWIGLKNFQRLFADSYFWGSLKVTLIYLVFVVILSLGAGLVSALLMNQSFRMRGLVRGAISLPWAFPDVPTVLVFMWIINPSFGVANILVRLIPGVTDNLKWLQDSNLAMPIVVAISAWKAFPFYSLAILAALQAVPAELREAARVDGADTIRIFRYVTLPEIIPTLVLMAVLASIFAFRQFSIIFLLTGGGPGRITETLVVRMYRTAFTDFDFSYGATLGVAGFLAALGFTILFIVIQVRQSRENA
jgi:multiple sugar transport system permease protein